MPKMLKPVLLLLGAGLILTAGWWIGGRRHIQAAPEVGAKTNAPAATPQEQSTAKRQLNIAAIASLFEVDESVASELLKEYEGVLNQYRQLTRDTVLENDPPDVAAFYIRSLGVRAEANPILKEWLAERPGTFIGESIWSESAAIPRLKSPVPDFLLVGKYRNSGTGFFVSPDGWMITNAHVIGQHKQVDIRGASGIILSATVVKADAKSDVALLKVDTPPRDYLEIRSDELPLGTGVFTIGYPNVDTQGAQVKFTEGSISSLAGWKDDPNDYQISVPLQQGNSGGALVDIKTGLTAGMVTSSLSPSRADNVGYAIKASVLADLVRSTPECSGISLRTNAVKDTDREANIERAQKASVMVLVR